MDVKQAFGIALRNARKRQKLTQEDFSIVSSRTYLSCLERGTKAVSLEKVVELTERLGIHPLALIVETFLVIDPGLDLEQLVDSVKSEMKKPS
ncbi:helix-turn-helix domain-containing protein [Pseudomonas japonica]|uniref:Helix-turn-helix n=1 Tax=Pseudomonas japonica TaxID=256466 RepID=A0A239I3E5_9PSED|nr:helix-turn-helix transcriptional regulator [Pseudomonas japonica]SNS88039.1 Helix-turn-helix [Pseudomonas japonica]